MPQLHPRKRGPKHHLDGIARGKLKAPRDPLSIKACGQLAADSEEVLSVVELPVGWDATLPDGVLKLLEVNRHMVCRDHHLKQVADLRADLGEAAIEIVGAISRKLDR